MASRRSILRIRAVEILFAFHQGLPGSADLEVDVTVEVTGMLFPVPQA